MKDNNVTIVSNRTDPRRDKKLRTLDWLLSRRQNPVSGAIILYLNRYVYLRPPNEI